jgi:hypothetical protein
MDFSAAKLFRTDVYYHVMTEQKQPVSYEWKQVTMFRKYMKELSLTITTGVEPGSEESLRIMVVKNGVRTFALSLLRRVKQDKEDNQSKYAEYVLEVDARAGLGGVLLLGITGGWLGCLVLVVVVDVV